jgi:hypothetical protein
MIASPVAAHWRETEKKTCPICNEVFWPSEGQKRKMWEAKIACGAACGSKMSAQTQKLQRESR